MVNLSLHLSQQKIPLSTAKSMISLLGEFEATADAKGRVLFPSALKRQLPPDSADKFVLNRGFEKQLNLYPYPVWKEETERLAHLNLFDKDSRTFYRMFHNGATELFVDGQGRILIPQHLISYAGIKKEIVFYAYSSRIEIWSLAEFKKATNDKSIDVAALAEKVMGNKDKQQ